MIEKDYFPSVVGQKTAKSKLGLNLEAFKVNKFLPPILFVSARGTGKTLLLTELAKNLVNENGQIRPYVLINCASIKNLGQFIDQLVIPYQNQEISFLWDECHNMPKDVVNWLLSVISPNKERKSFNYHNNVRYEWDFTQTSWVSGSTNPEKLSEPYKSRHERIDLEEYTDLDLVKILYINSPNMQYLDNVEIDIASVCRGTPREVVKLSDKVRQFLDINKKYTFDKNDWAELKKRAGINYLGLSSIEIQHLQSLKDGELSLGALSSKLRLDSTTVKRDIERFLWEKSLINVDGKRFLSHKGREVLKELEKV